MIGFLAYYGASNVAVDLSERATLNDVLAMTGSFHPPKQTSFAADVINLGW